MADKQQKNSKKQGSHLAPYKWPKGVSGNPKGRPKGLRLSELMREKLEDDPKLRSKILEAWALHVLKGSPSHLKELLDRLEGKVPLAIQTQTEGPTADALTAEMDAVTLPSSPRPAMDDDGEICSGPGGASERQDGTG